MGFLTIIFTLLSVYFFYEFRRFHSAYKTERTAHEKRADLLGIYAFFLFKTAEKHNMNEKDIEDLLVDLYEINSVQSWQVANRDMVVLCEANNVAVKYRDNNEMYGIDKSVIKQLAASIWSKGHAVKAIEQDARQEDQRIDAIMSNPSFI